MNSPIRKVKLIYRNILAFKAYCYRFNTLKYKDPLTDKWRTVTVSYTRNTSRARKQAEREVMDKIEN